MVYRPMSFNERANLQALHSHWTTFIENHLWDWYVGLTVRGAIKLALIKDKFKKWVHRLNRRQFGKRYYKRRKRICWVASFESQERGVYHIHSLLGHVEDLDRREWRDKWIALGGGIKSIVEPYIPGLGGADYISKAIGYGDDIEFDGNWSRN